MSGQQDFITLHHTTEKILFEVIETILFHSFK